MKWITNGQRKAKWCINMTNERLKELGATSPNDEVSTMAYELLALREAVREIKKLKQVRLEHKTPTGSRIADVVATVDVLAILDKAAEKTEVGE